MLREFEADLHIHTCLSPCGDLKMSPGGIVKEAVKEGIDLIAICDHNSSENAGAVIKASEGKGVAVLPGIEITSKEEVHISALFDHFDDALKLQMLIYENLDGENDEEVFGMQVVVNEKGEVLGFNKKLLIGATNLSVEEIVNAIHSFHGLAIAAHIDREGFGIIGQLGFIPPELGLDALEISPKMEMEEARTRFSEYHKYPFLCSSDAHYLDDIGKGTTTFLLEEASLKELRMALKGEGGRGIC
ncbi:PHP domain-containing protein [candidate division KSB1 bacterium]|nr:PHP domain-containing protein [candidate division KSB1 bacterium]